MFWILTLLELLFANVISSSGDGLFVSFSVLFAVQSKGPNMW